MLNAVSSSDILAGINSRNTSTGSAPETESFAAQLQRATANRDVATSTSDNDETVKQAFDQFVGQTLFGQMLSSMRKTVGEPAYFHGGQAEEMFRGQLDQILAERMTEASAGQMSQSLYRQFELSI